MASPRPCRRLYSGSRSPAWRGWWTCPTPPAPSGAGGWDSRRRRRARGAPRARHACPPNAPCVSPSPLREDTAPAPREPTPGRSRGRPMGPRARRRRIGPHRCRYRPNPPGPRRRRHRGPGAGWEDHHRRICGCPSPPCRRSRRPEPYARRPVVSELPIPTTGSFSHVRWQAASWPGKKLCR